MGCFSGTYKRVVIGSILFIYYGSHRVFFQALFNAMTYARLILFIPLIKSIRYGNNDGVIHWRIIMFGWRKMPHPKCFSSRIV